MLAFLLNSLLHTLLAAILILCYSTFLSRWRRLEQSQANQLKIKQKDYQELIHKNQVLVDKNHRLEQQQNQTARLYEITKNMSETLNLATKTHILQQNIWNLLGGTCLRIIMFKSSAPKLTIDCISEIKPEHKNSTHIYTQPTEEDLSVLNCMTSTQFADLIIKQDQPSQSSRITLKTTVQSLIALPLKHNKMIYGLLIIENMPDSDIDKARIIASQLTLDVSNIQLYKKVQQLSITDGLTGVYLRRYLNDRLSEELQRSHEQQLHLCLLMIDIDHFKSFNDEHGHLVGDYILKTIAHILTDKTRESDLVSRFGGEEFCILLPETSLQDAKQIAERIRQSVEKYHFQIHDKSLKATISIGLASNQPNTPIAQELIDLADKALYAAKEQGRNRLVILA